MSEVEKQNYISLQVATEFCEYSQEYLSLRARQGKLRAVKQGRNWLTTKEWLEQYIESAEVYKNGLEEKRNGNGKVGENVQGKKIVKIATPVQMVRELPTPPNNLPIAETVRAKDIVEEPLPEPASHFAFAKFGKFAVACALAIFVLVSSFYLSGNSSFSFEPEQRVAGVTESIQRLSGVFGKFISQIAQNARSKFSYVEERFADFKFFAERKRGLVVVPSTDKDELVKEQIRASFSDEVSISLHDDDSGIITPIFRERVGNDYLYLLVPVNDEP